MYDEVLVCLDGSRFAEGVIPYARGVATPAEARLTLLRVVDYGEDFSAAKRYCQSWAGLLKAREKVVAVKDNIVATILQELQDTPKAIPAITTHGHTGIWEPLLGSVALGVVRGARRPILLYSPRRIMGGSSPEQEFRVSSLVAALDGSEFSERIIPFVAEIARSLKLNLELIQVLPISGGLSQIPAELKGDVLEASYLRRCTAQIEEKYGLKAAWDVLHGDPSKAVCSYVQGREGLILAMTSRARPALEHAIFGSVAGECVRHAGVPILIYWPGAATP